jgi:diguanylate cyclase (GGDEF)-like protein
LRLRIPLAASDRVLGRLSRASILAVASCVVGGIGIVDYLTGYEVSVSEFYIAPVALAAWYAGRSAGVGIAVLSCISWFLADALAGLTYEHPAAQAWNLLVRFGYFVLNVFLVAALRASLFHQRHLATTDSLTGVFTRRAFEERLEHDLLLARRKGSPLTLAFVDLDDFKALNDTRGHGIGDQALRATAQAMKGATRRSDTVARLGGDEFAFVLPDTGRPSAQEVVARLRHDLRRSLDAIAPQLTCSVGVITFEEIPRDAAEALRNADALMYEAKRQGKDSALFRVIAIGTVEGERSESVAVAP